MAAGCGHQAGDGPSNGSGPTATTATTGVEAEAIVVYDAVVVATHPHDPDAFTQGLELVDGLLLESTGLVGDSSIRLVEPTTGVPAVSRPIDGALFGEGATVVGDEVWQLTWRDEVLLVHALDGLRELRRVPYDGEGWGLCDDGDRLVMSNGSDRLTFRDRSSFAVLGSVAVTEQGRPLDQLNELECSDGLVWANVWQTERLVAIDPASGAVVGVVDLGPLVPRGEDGTVPGVANGIAADPETGRFWLTGKNWPVIHEVELRPVD